MVVSLTSVYIAYLSKRFVCLVLLLIFYPTNDVQTEIQSWSKPLFSYIVIMLCYHWLIMKVLVGYLFVPTFAYLQAKLNFEWKPG